MQLLKVGLCLLKWTQLKGRKKELVSSFPWKSGDMAEPKHGNTASLVLLLLATAHSRAERKLPATPGSNIQSQILPNGERWSAVPIAQTKSSEMSCAELISPTYNIWPRMIRWEAKVQLTYPIWGHCEAVSGDQPNWVIKGS